MGLCPTPTHRSGVRPWEMIYVFKRVWGCACFCKQLEHALRGGFVAAIRSAFSAVDLTPPASRVKKDASFRQKPGISNIFTYWLHPVSKWLSPMAQRGFTTALCNLGAVTLHYTIVFYRCSTSTTECKEDYIQKFNKLRNPAAIFWRSKQHFVQED